MSVYHGVTLCARHREIDLEKLASMGFKIAYIAVSDGYIVDDMVYEHYERAKKAGLKLGYIHTLDCRNRPQGQAEFFVGAIRGLECHTRLATNAICCSPGTVEKCLNFNRRVYELSGIETVNIVRSRCAKLLRSPVWFRDEVSSANVNYIGKKKLEAPLENICEQSVEISTFTEDIFIPPVCILKNGMNKR